MGTTAALIGRWVVPDTDIPRWPDRLLRALFTPLHRRLRRRTANADRHGAHAAALTSAGKLILVRLRYAPGWRLPGGGRDPAEALESAALRELREEIGLRSHGRVRTVGDLVVVEDVEYRPRRWSWEVEAVAESALDQLPPDLSPRHRRWICAILPKPALGVGAILPEMIPDDRARIDGHLRREI